MDSNTVEKALRKLGCDIRPGSRHKKCKLVIDGVLIGLTTLPKKPKRDINRNWLSQIKQAMCIDTDDELLDYARSRRTRTHHRQKPSVLGKLRQARRQG